MGLSVVNVDIAGAAIADNRRVSLQWHRTVAAAIVADTVVSTLTWANIKGSATNIGVVIVSSRFELIHRGDEVVDLIVGSNSGERFGFAKGITSSARTSCLQTTLSLNSAGSDCSTLRGGWL